VTERSRQPRTPPATQHQHACQGTDTVQFMSRTPILV
jgi:hypothetical protein